MTAARAKRIRAATAGLLAIFALVTLRMAYGHWTQSLAVEGSVTTAAFGAHWTSGYCCKWGALAPGVSGCVAALPPAGDGVTGVTYGIDNSDDSRYLVTVSGGYPGLSVGCWLVYENNGSIPWKVTGRRIEPSTGLTGCPSGGTANPSLVCNEMDITWTDGIGAVVYPQPEGEQQTGRLVVSIKDGTAGARPATAYGFTVYHLVQQCTSAACLGGGG